MHKKYPLRVNDAGLAHFDEPVVCVEKFGDLRPSRLKPLEALDLSIANAKPHDYWPVVVRGAPKSAH